MRCRTWILWHSSTLASLLLPSVHHSRTFRRLSFIILCRERVRADAKKRHDSWAKAKDALRIRLPTAEAASEVEAPALLAAATGRPPTSGRGRGPVRAGSSGALSAGAGAPSPLPRMDFSRGASTGRSCGPLAKHAFPTSTAEQALLMMTASAHDGGGPKGAAPPMPPVVHALGSSSQPAASADLKKSRAALLERGHVFAANFVVPETGALDVSALKDAVKGNAALRERLRIAREKADKEAAAFSDWSGAKAAVAAAEDCLSLLVLPAVAAAEAAGLFQRASPASGSAPATTASGGLAVGAVSGAAAAAREAKSLSALSLSPGPDDVALWRAVGYACRAIHASSLREPWVEWATSAGVFSREECAREWAAFTPPPDSGGDWTPRDRTAAVRLLEALCEEARVARATAATAALEQPPPAVHLLRVPALEAAPRFVYGSAEAIAAARLLSGSGYSPRAAAAGNSGHGDDGADDDASAGGAASLARLAATGPHASATTVGAAPGGAAAAAAPAPAPAISGVPVPEGCPLHVIGGTGVGAEVVLQWFCGEESPEPSATAAPAASSAAGAAKAGGGVGDDESDDSSGGGGYSSDEFDDHDSDDESRAGRGGSDRKAGSSRDGSDGARARRRKSRRRGGAAAGAEAAAAAKSRRKRQQLPYAIVLETCGVTGGKDQVEGRWTQVAVDPPDPSAILSAPSASSFVPLDRAVQGLSGDECTPPAAAPGVDPFALHRDGEPTRMRGCIRITGLTPNTSYCYRARAFTRAGASHFAFIVVTTAPAPPPAPILARMSALPLPLLAPADVAEAKACRALPAASPTSLRLCWSPAPCRRANLMRLLRLFRLAAALTQILQTRSSEGRRAHASDAAAAVVPTAPSLPATTADLAVLLRCVCKEYGTFSFLSLALASPRVWPRADGAADVATPGFSATAGASSAEGGVGGFRPGASAPVSVIASSSSRRVPCSVMEALQARLRAADTRGRSRVISLPGLLSLFAADDARLTPHPGGGGRYLLHAPSRDALLLTMSAAAAAAGDGSDAAAFAGLVHGPTSAGESRYVLLRCASDGYGHAYDGAVPGSAAGAGALTSPRSPHAASAQVWQEVGAGVRSLRSVPELAPGTAYTFRVQAVNAEGIPSALSYAATAVTALPKVSTLKTPSAPASASGSGASSAVAALGSVSSGASGSAAGAGGEVTSANVTWAYDAPLAAAPRTAAVLLPDGVAHASAAGGGAGAHAHVATLLKQVQARRGGGAGAASASAGTPRAGSSAAGGSSASAPGGSAESWLSLRRHWDRLLGLPSHSDGPSLALSAAVASDAIDAFQLRGLLADLGVLGECYGPPAAALARYLLGGALQVQAAQAGASAGGASATGSSEGAGESSAPSPSTAAVVEALAGVGLSNVSRVRWLTALACLLPGVSADGLSLAAAAPVSTPGPLSPAASLLCPYDRFRLWWEGALADVDAAALLHSASTSSASQMSAPAAAAAHLLPHGAGPVRTASAPAVNVTQPLLFVVEVSRHESDESDDGISSASIGAAGSVTLGSLLDPLGSSASAAVGGGAPGQGMMAMGIGMAAAEDAAGPGWLPWRVHSIGGDCMFALRDLAPNKQCRVRVTAVSRAAAAITSPVLPVCTRPLAPFAPVPIRTTPRSASVRWYPAVGGAAKFILQIRRLGTVAALAAGAMKAAGSSSSSSSSAAGHLWHGRNVDEAVSRHLQVSSAVPLAAGRPPTPNTGAGHADSLSLGGSHAGALWTEELSGGRSLVSSKGSRASGGSSAGAGSGATAWTVAYAGPQCFAVIPGLSGSCVYRLRVLAEGATGLLSVPSVETQIVTPPSGGLGPAAAATAAQYERTPERAAVHFPLPVPSLRIDRAIAALAAGAYGGPAGGPGASAAAAELFLTAPLQLSASAAGGGVADASGHAFPCPDVVVGDCVVWTEPVCALLPRAVADAIEFHFIASDEGYAHGMTRHHDGASPSTPPRHHDGGPRSRAAREADGSHGAAGVLSTVALRALCQALASCVEDSRPWTAVPGAVAAASAAGFSPAALAEAGLRPVIVCRRTVAASIMLDSASGVSSGSAAVHTVDRRSFEAESGAASASATAGAIGLRASLTAGASSFRGGALGYAGSVASDGSDGSDSDADSLPGDGPGMAAARTRRGAADALLSAVDANPAARSEVARWHSRTLTLAVEWCSVGPPGDASEALSAEAAAAFPCRMRPLSRPYPPDIASSVSKRFALSNGALVKRSGALLAQLGSFRAEWEDEAGRWSAAEEACASLLQRQ